jgi:putative hydroxymethylpyrimidine transport system substrate-binding protein
MTRRLAPLTLLPVLLLIVALAGCGEKEDVLEPSGSQRVELMLDYFPNADHAGIYAAQAAGYFEQAGLDVEIRQPPDPAAPIKQVAAGRVDVAISYEPEVFRARDQGLDVVAVGAIVREPLTSIISLPKAKIREPADLEGKTVGTAGIDYQTAYLQTIVTEAGIPPESVKERNVGFRLVPALLTGKVDAVLGAFWNYEGTQLKLEGKKPRIIRMEDAGVPTYDELVLVANANALERDGDKLRALIGAIARGTRELRRDPEEGIRGLLEANPDLDPKLQRAVVDVTMPLFFPVEGRPFGWQDPEAWDAFGAWMEDRNLLENPPDVRATFTNELLPGAGL